MSLALVNKLKPMNIPFGPKSILHWLADESRDGETVSFGVEYLAGIAGCTGRTAQKHLRVLESMGILVPLTMLVGRGKYPTYRINLDVIIAPPAPAKPRGLRKTRMVPTDEEPRMPPPIRTALPDADVAPAAAAHPGPDVTIDVEQLKERRNRILALIERARAGERNALDWWNRDGDRAMEQLGMINQFLGLDAQIEEGLTV